MPTLDLMFKNVKDAEGHEHGNDGKFVSTGGSSGEPAGDFEATERHHKTGLVENALQHGEDAPETATRADVAAALGQDLHWHRTGNPDGVQALLDAPDKWPRTGPRHEISGALHNALGAERRLAKLNEDLAGDTLEERQKKHEAMFGKRAGHVEGACYRCDGYGRIKYSDILDGVCFKCNGSGVENVKIEQPKTVANRDKRMREKMTEKQWEDAQAEWEAKKKWGALWDRMEDRTKQIDDSFDQEEPERDPSDAYWGGPAHYHWEQARQEHRDEAGIHQLQEARDAMMGRHKYAPDEEDIMRRLHRAEAAMVDMGIIDAVTDPTRNPKGFVIPESDRNSEHIGNVGAQYEAKLTVTKWPPLIVEGQYGTRACLNLRDGDGNRIQWWTNPSAARKLYDEMEANPDDALVSFTVKDHGSYQNMKHTGIIRPKVVKPKAAKTRKLADLVGDIVKDQSRDPDGKFAAGEKGDGYETCRHCGSEDLFDGYFRGRSKEALAYTDDPKARYRTSCSHCGKFQDEKVKATRKLADLVPA